MSTLDDKLASWREATRTLEPSAAVLEKIRAAASAPTELPATSPKPPVGGLWLISVAVLVAGALLVWSLWPSARRESDGHEPGWTPTVAGAPASPLLPGQLEDGGCQEFGVPSAVVAMPMGIGNDLAALKHELEVRPLS